MLKPLSEKLMGNKICTCSLKALCSDVKNTLTCPCSKNGCRHVENSESETLMSTLQAETPEALTISIILSSPFPGSSLAEYDEVHILFMDVAYFLLGYLK
jgi:hypothetical protein